MAGWALKPRLEDMNRQAVIVIDSPRAIPDRNVSFP